MLRNLRLRVICTLVAATLLAACNVAPAGVQVHDPYEATNRRVHEFNKGLDRAIIRPVALTVARLPADVTDPVVNFAENTVLPGMVVNGLLQGDIKGVASNTLRFLLNSTFGIGGFYDPADAIGLFEQSTDFGETLAVWGVPEGAYRELPVRGPSTERDSAGKIVDIFLDPLGYILNADQRIAVTATRIGGTVIKRGRFANTVDSVLYDSADSYAQARILYLQNRRFQLGQGATGGATDPYGDTCAGGFEDPYADPAADPCAAQ